MSESGSADVKICRVTHEGTSVQQESELRELRTGVSQLSYSAILHRWDYLPSYTFLKHGGVIVICHFIFKGPTYQDFTLASHVLELKQSLQTVLN